MSGSVANGGDTRSVPRDALDTDRAKEGNRRLALR